MSSGLAGSQQQTETTAAVHNFGAGVFPPLFMNNALSGQTPPPGLDVQQMVLASLDPSIANNPFQALYLSQLAAMSGQVSQASAEPSPSSSSAAVSSSSNGGAQSSLSPSADSANQMSITESQSAFNALSAGNLTGASTSDPSPTPGTTTSQSGEPAIPGGSAVADLPSWLTGLLPATQNANVSKPSQTVPTSTTPTTSSIPSFFEQMQLMTAAQTILGTSGVNPANAFASQPLNALAAALGQSAVAAQTTAASSVASLTANNTNAFMAASATNYSSPVKDAYCELCDKNFCNRYFLRTHRQKKHGILDDGSPVKNYSVASSVHNSVPSFPQGLASFGSLLPPPSTSLSAASNMQLPANLAALMAACSGNTVLPATSATVASSISQPTSVIVSSANSESPVNKVRKVSSPETEKTDNENDEDEKNKNLTMNGNSFSTTENTAFPAEKPSECDRCGKSFPSLFALLTHKACEHTPVHLSNSANPDMTSQRTPSKLSSHVTPKNEEKIACEMCDKEFESRQYLQQHILVNHSGIPNAQSLLGLLPGGIPLPFMLSPGLQQSLQMQDMDQNGMLAGLNGQLSNPKQSIKRQYSSSGKNYCNLCNKEVCNKYFLRTHMLKMHGIVIDENKTVIANIDTLERERMGALSFRCDICMAELKSRHLLRSHKQEMHGVVSLHTPIVSQNRTQRSNSTGAMPSLLAANQAALLSAQLNEKLFGLVDCGGERCPTCDVRCKTVVQLQEHIIEKHCGDLPTELFESIQKAQQRALIAQTAAVVANQREIRESITEVKCQWCNEKFGDEVQRHMHTIHAHSTELRQSHEQLMSSAAPKQPQQSQPLSPSDSSPDRELLKCPQVLCSYRTQRSENLAIHLERHQPLNHSLNDLQNTSKQSVNSSASVDQTSSSISNEEEDEAMRATTEVALKMAKQNEQEKPCCCPVVSCQRRYHDMAAVERHISKVHRWQLKLSPKKPSNGVISPSRLLRLTKRYACQFAKCSQRFSTRQQCRSHVLSHFRASALSNDKDQQRHQSSVDPQTSKLEDTEVMDTYVREEDENELKETNGHIAGRDVQKEHERHSHTSGSSSPISDQMAEGYARPSDSTSGKPYTVQSFLMREQSSDESNGYKGCSVLREMIAHLPVRTLITEPVCITVELVPAPHIDAQVMHV